MKMSKSQNGTPNRIVGFISYLRKKVALQTYIKKKKTLNQILLGFVGHC